MRIISALVFVVTAGILCSSIALGYSPSEKGLIHSILQLISDSPNSTNYIITNEKVEIITKLLMESCEKNGGPKAYETVKRGWQDFSNCGKRAVSKVDRMPYTDENDLVYHVKKFCAISMMEEDCIKQFQGTAEPCLEPGERETIKRIYSIIISFFDFMCEIDGARIIKFIADGGMQCLQYKKDELLNCSTQLSNQYNPATGVQSIVSNIEDCIGLEKLQLCTVKLLNECEHHAPADIVDAMFDSVKRELECGMISEASMSSAIDVVLITIGMGIFLHFD